MQVINSSTAEATSSSKETITRTPAEAMSNRNVIAPADIPAKNLLKIASRLREMVEKQGSGSVLSANFNQLRDNIASLTQVIPKQSLLLFLLLPESSSFYTLFLYSQKVLLDNFKTFRTIIMNHFRTN